LEAAASVNEWRPPQKAERTYGTESCAEVPRPDDEERHVEAMAEFSRRILPVHVPQADS
jgi:hypothetical protein